MRTLAALLLFATPALATPRLVPARDVTVAYSVAPKDHQPIQVTVAIEGGGEHLRIASESLPTSFLVDRGAHRLAILLPLLKLYSTVGTGRFDPQETVLKDARFERHGARRLAGLACTDWSARSEQGTASACITEDGVILAGTAADKHGPLGSVRATNVHYGALPKMLFRLPSGYRDAGKLPIGQLAGVNP